MTLLCGDSAEYIQSDEFDQQVVYLDPMFPDRKKSAAVKKDMQLLERLLGEVEESSVLHVALESNARRVVVKRPKHAPFLEDLEPGLQFMGKSGRFDVYPRKSVDTEVL